MYLTIALSLVVLIIVMNLIFDFSAMTLLYLVISFAWVLLPSLALLFLVRLMPNSWFNCRIFNVSKSEYKFYDKLKIRSWKDKVPECGKLVNFKKSKLADPKDDNYMYKFVKETIYAEVLHGGSIITSIIGFLFVPNSVKLTMGLPIMVLYILVNLPSFMIQRHTRYRLKKVIKPVKNLENKDLDSNGTIEEKQN